MKSIVIITLIIGIYSWAQERDAALADALASANCRPSDKNERAIQTIVDGHVFCEKHQRVSYGQHNTITLACPIQGACNQIASLP